MSSCRKLLSAALLSLAASAALAQAAAPAASITGLGRPATAKELASWDIDVRPDFKGLPKGSGTVAKGMEVWEAKCASCHGIFGESNEIFSPMIGGTSKADLSTGRVARLLDDSFPGRTTLMKLSTVSTLWDYINRAMPWNNPKTLTVEEVYAVTAYVLNLGGVLPDNFTLSDQNMAQVQAMLPNRNGKTTDHGLWPGRSLGNGGRPDVRAVACMKDCAVEPTVKSFLPEHARNAHGNLAEQNRLFGAQLGADTSKPSGTPFVPPSAPAAAAAGATTATANPASLFKKHSCNACHGVENKLVGPGMREVGKKYAGRADAVDVLASKIVNGSAGVWGAIPMPAQTLSPADAKALARWITEGAKP
jgi:cytochrome c551/c552